MTDQKQHKTFFLGQFDQFISTGAHLRNAARGRLRFLQIHGLNRINHHHRGIGFFQSGDDVFDIGGRSQIDRRVFKFQPFGADFDLIGGFFAGNVITFGTFGQIGNTGANLQQQSRFADAGIAADQNDRPRNQTAAADTVKFHDVGMQAPQNLRCAAQRDKIKQIAFFLGIKIRKTFAADLFFNNGIPFAAGIAFPLPFRINGAAILTCVFGSAFFCHSKPPL